MADLNDSDDSDDSDDRTEGPRRPSASLVTSEPPAFQVMVDANGQVICEVTRADLDEVRGLVLTLAARLDAIEARLDARVDALGRVARLDDPTTPAALRALGAKLDAGGL